MTVTAMPGRQQAIRLRRPPLLEPCHDDGPGNPPAGPAALLPLDWPPAPAPRPATAAPRVPAGVRPDPAARAAATAQRYVQVCLEVLNGFRPAAHLRTLAGPVEFTAVVGQLARRRNAAGHFPALGAAAAPGPQSGPRSGSARPADRHDATAPPNTGRAAPIAAGRTAPANTGRGAQPYRLQRLRLSEPRPGVAEVVAVLSHAGQSMAVAMRLELQGDRWQCVVVQII